MQAYSSDIAFTPTVKALQEHDGSRGNYARMEAKGGWRTTVDEQLSNFIAERDSFYMGTTNSEGQPYIQHRGGAPGFLKVLDEKTLGFADFRGNRQFITAGNLIDSERAFLFLMDYPTRRRIKIWGRARIVDDASLLERLVDSDYAAKPERAVVFEIEAWDVNCPQHITPRYSEAEMAATVGDLRRRVSELEDELRTLRTRNS